MMQSTLLQLRIELGLSQEKLAKKCGVTTAKIAEWESNKRPPPAQVMRMIELLIHNATVNKD